jgi:hypothetical protein
LDGFVLSGCGHASVLEIVYRVGSHFDFEGFQAN